jgi:hypothetical protein
MKKYSLFFLAMFLAGAMALTCLFGAVSAQNEDNIQYPVAELDGCKDKDACKAYCDLPQNMKACVEFAKKNGLMSAQELQEAEKFLALGGKGPGGCTGKAACEIYCDDTRHTAECIKFAIENELLLGQELEEAKKALAAIEKGATPPPCRGKKECDAYCEEPSHMEECINFGIQAGFIQGKELEDAQKMLAAVKKGAVPPKCKGKEECDIYCRQEEHFQECTDFALAAGFMTEEEAAMARKTGGKGPGGCRGKEECDAFCNNPANQQTCMQFGIDNGLIPPEELQKMEEGKKMMRQSLAQAPGEVIACLQEQLGSDMVEKMKNGTAMPSQNAGDQMRQCFEKFMPMGPGGQPGMAPGGMSPGMNSPGGCANEEECKQYCLTNPDECKNYAPGGMTGPGGCKSEEECKAYCQANPNECSNFVTAGGAIPGGQTGTPSNTMPGMGPGMTGPGGCNSPESCQAYCQSNPAVCQNFVPPQGTAPMPGQTMMPPMPMEPGGATGVEGQTGTAPGTMPGQQMYGTSPEMPTNFDPNMQPPMPSMPMNSPQPPADLMPPMPPDSTQSPPPPPPASQLNQNSFLAALITVLHYFFPFW